MTTVALVCNPFSDGNGGQAGLADHAATLPGVLACAPTTPDDLAEALKSFADAGIDVLAVDGGDGTLREVMTLLPEIFGDHCPPLALLPSGKTNLAARDVGSFGGGKLGLTRLLDMVRDGWRGARWSERQALEVIWPDHPQRRLRGFLFGAGAFTHATRMAGSWAHDHGFRQRSAVAIGVARVLWEALRGNKVLADPMVEYAPDGSTAATSAAPRFLMLATTARKLMLGLWPFLPPADGPALNWLGVAHPPRRLPLALWKAWRGTLPDPALGVEGGRCHRLDLRLGGDFVVDGEVYQTGPAGIALQAGPTFRFVAG